MNKNFWLAIAAIIILTGSIFAQETKPTPTPETKSAPSPVPQIHNPFDGAPEAKPEDVASIDAITKAVYDVISGDAGVKRDWNRFRSLFHPSARLIPTFKNREGKFMAQAITPEEYITGNSKFLEEKGFHEREIARRVEQYGNIAHVFTTYETKFKLSDEKPFMRGINSVQLFNDGKRWWVLSIAWSAETPETILPEKYLKSVQ